MQGILLDQFGVLHDGRQALPEAGTAVKAMAAAGLRVYILSNSSRRASFALDKIAKLGYAPDAFFGTPKQAAYSFHCVLLLQPWYVHGMQAQ